MTPKVSFVVPCYKLAHLLPECIHSILSQSYGDFEILIMDDCSPDNTAEVARSFNDPRVQHIRNEPNLGHLRNYNKGIGFSRGEYIWLISADDRLRHPDAIARYVEAMEKNPKVGYVCCPAMEMKGSQETGVARYSVVAERDTVFDGHDFLHKLSALNCVIAASGMVRKSCYDKLGAFPLDMPYAGDWYLWCRFALYYDVAYLAEPMVNYRLHEGSMTSALMEKDPRVCAREDLSVLWRVAHDARDAQAADIVRLFHGAIVSEYVRLITGRKYGVSSTLSLQDFRDVLRQHAGENAEAAWVRARVYSLVADFHFANGDYAQASEFYRLALRDDPSMTKARIKATLLRTGRVGVALRNLAFGFHRLWTQGRQHS